MHLSVVIVVFVIIIVTSCLAASANTNNGIQLQQAQLDVLASSFRPPGSSNARTMADMDTISVIMRTLMPSMFNLFANITSDEYKSQFQDPCRFDPLLDIFSQLPAYFDTMAKKYAPKTDLVAYYSMQLASTFLVNNNSLTMTCLYNMMSLQSRLKTFSLDLMDNPEKNFHLVGLFGFFIKPVMGMLKQNAMMKIIDHVEKYESNEDMSTITKFNVLNVVFLIVGTVAICANLLLIVLLRRTASLGKVSEAKNCGAVVVKNSNVVPAVSSSLSGNKPIYKKTNRAHQQQVCCFFF